MIHAFQVASHTFTTANEQGPAKLQRQDSGFFIRNPDHQMCRIHRIFFNKIAQTCPDSGQDFSGFSYNTLEDGFRILHFLPGSG
jgi:hypothetical protein